MYERREETWRPLNRRRVAAFLQLYFLAMVYGENAHRRGRQHPVTTKMLKKALVKRVIPFIYRNRVWVMEADQWPITLEHFEELNVYLAANLPNIHAGHYWQNIMYYYGEIKKEQEEEEMERRQRQARLDQVRRVLQL